MKATEQLQLQTNADTQDNEQSGKQLVEHRRFEDSPFTAVRVEDKGWILVLGNDLVSEGGDYFDSYEDIKEWHDSKPWKLIFITATIVARDLEKIIGKIPE